MHKYRITALPGLNEGTADSVVELWNGQTG